MFLCTFEIGSAGEALGAIPFNFQRSPRPHAARFVKSRPISGPSAFIQPPLSGNLRPVTIARPQSSPSQLTTMNPTVRRVAAAGARRAKLPLRTSQAAYRAYATVTATTGDSVEDFVSKAESKQVEIRIDLVS